MNFINSEQLKLMKIKKELELFLNEINESINALKVEELTLKSYSLEQWPEGDQKSEMQLVNLSVAELNEPVYFKNGTYQLNTTLPTINLNLKRTVCPEEEDSE